MSLEPGPQPKRTRVIGWLYGIGGLSFALAGVLLLIFDLRFGLSLQAMAPDLAKAAREGHARSRVVGLWHAHTVPPKPDPALAPAVEMDAKTEKGLKEMARALEPMAQAFDAMQDIEFNADGTYVQNGLAKVVGRYRVDGNLLYMTPKRVSGLSPEYAYA